MSIRSRIVACLLLAGSAALADGISGSITPQTGGGLGFDGGISRTGCVPVVTNIGTQSANAAGSISLTGVTVPAASLIIVEGSAFNSTGGTVSDGVNIYTALTPSAAAGSNGATLFYAPNASLSGGTITYTPNAGNNTRAMSAAWVSNITTSSPLDTSVTASTTGSGTSPIAPSITSGTPAQTGELFVGLVGGDGNGASAASMTQDTADGWAFPPNFKVDPAGAGTFFGGGTKVNSGAGTRTFAPAVSFTGGAASKSWVIAVYGFKHC